MDPPAYETIDSTREERAEILDPYAKIATRLSLRDELHVSRLQHVAALVVQLLPHIRARARQGLSKTLLLVLPSDSKYRESPTRERNVRPDMIQQRALPKASWSGFPKI